MPVMQLDLGPLLPQHVEEIVAGFLLLALLWFIFAKYVSPMFEKMYQERASQIEGGIMRAQKAEADAAAAKQQYETQLANARQDAAKVREEARAQGATLAQQLHDQAVKDASRLIDQGRSQVEAERLAAQDELRSEIGGLATTLAGRIVGHSMANEATAQATIDEFLAQLETIDAREAQPS
ncbi:MAG: F0F1 ATP synthase subunit B [Propionibacteriaceae bacterium]|nr:F0F1 ATP synthase subunit B [Propionibacteriaceae bacterium]